MTDIPRPEGSKWTEDQWEAIALDKKPMLVSAAAGSGKTAVLVERIVRKVTDTNNPVDLNKLLIVTFTNAAAAEMKQRIGKALEETLAENPESQHLRRQLSQLQRANISTLHAFCMNVIRTYYYEVGVDPAFRMLDETEAALLEDEVMEELFESAYSEESDFYTLVDYFTGDRTDEELKRLLLDLYHFSRSHPDPETWLADTVSIYENSENVPFDDLDWVKEAKNYVRLSLDGAVSMYEQALRTAEAPGGPHKYIELLEEEVTMIKNASSAYDWENLKSAVTNFHFKRMPPVKKSDTDIDSDLQKQVQNIRDEVKKKMKNTAKDYFSAPSDVLTDEMQKMAPVIRTLTKYVSLFSKNYQEAKLEKNALHFSDLEHYCLDILRDKESGRPTSAAYQYQSQFDEVLIDEYQDTNFVQEAVINLVSGSNTLFMVGDVKQSIYRFRLAEPGLFLQKYKMYEEEKSGRRIDLSKNFRSRETVLHAANFVFSRIMSEAIGEMEYDNAASLKQGNFNFPENGEEETEILLIDKQQYGDDDEEAEDMESSQLEARAAAEKIREMVDGGFPVFDKAKNTTRAVEYRDIVILMRSMPWADTMMEELRAAEIPVFADLNTGYFEAVEVKIMLSLLQVIDNPYQDIPLASLLRSPIFAFDEEKLTEIRLFAPEADFYSALKKAAEADYETSASVIQQISRWRDAVKSMGLAEFIWYLFDETGYVEYVGGLPGGKQRQMNLRSLYDRARSYEQTSFRGLFRFLRFVERMKERGDDLGKARAVGEQEDVVRMMTIHKSKGLEFPVVILAGMNKQFNMMDLNNSYLKHKELGFAARYIDPANRVSYPTLYYYVMKERLRREMLAEEMRILYVGMTRAEEKLILTGSVNNYDSSLKKWTGHLPALEIPETMRAGAKTFFDWIMPAFFTHTDSEPFLQKAGIPVLLQQKDLSRWRALRIPAASLQNAVPALSSKPEKLEAVENRQSVGVDITFVSRRFNWQYPYVDATSTEVKKSVTELKRAGEDPYSGSLWNQSAPVFDRPSFVQETNFSPAEKGTIMHTVMQYIPFSVETVEEVKKEVAILVEKEIITEKEAEQVNYKQVTDFLAGTEADRLRRAEWVKREIPFTHGINASSIYENWEGPEEKVFVQGIIDCVYKEEDGTVHILDYKTDQITNRFADASEAADYFRKRYKYQLTFYKKALESAWGISIASCRLYMMEGRMTLEIE
ncbi:helicase-exonuclease AddAB subunit AddA [Alkalicoccus saliphilus]|uniref:ATP-dependent helicase/nuclease subunit A n=1 Tax=Alkalicoccus saliphilus TaxID=200989 RepID=A0A2T4U850_9BACI|nr:helicase-exonuclease AddAB subunit AddA [Alkalicoccus saliphilus]PTL39577.1 helicase-exonuclease AddAB subunit AddA [Alkalicoccus saliphilus]